MEKVLIYVAAGLAAWSLVSKRLTQSPITGPMFFLGLGLLASLAFDIIPLEMELAEEEIAATFLELTLVLVLFSDAMTLHLSSWREDALIPGRLLGIGMPLVIAGGTAVAALMFTELGLAEAAILGTVLAPTDAALGQAVVTNPRVPERLRHGLNVESGLNDGITLPVLLFFIALVEAEEGATGFFQLIGQSIIFAVAVGIALGYLGARLLLWTCRRGWMGRTWRQIFVVTVAVLAFALSDVVNGSGFLGAFTAGLVFGRVIDDEYPDAHELVDELGQGLTMISFLLFGAVFLAPLLDEISWKMAVYAVLSLSLIRMIPVAVSMIGAKLEGPSILYLGWFGPRGLASIIFAGIVVAQGTIPGSDLIVLAMVTTVGLSVLLHGLTAAPGANAYGDWYARMGEAAEDMVESAPVQDMRTRRRIERM